MSRISCFDVMKFIIVRTLRHCSSPESKIFQIVCVSHICTFWIDKYIDVIIDRYTLTSIGVAKIDDIRAKVKIRRDFKCSLEPAHFLFIVS